MDPDCRLLIGDNLTHLKDMDAKSVDLIYADPPYNSSRSHNAPLGEDMAHEIAYEDHWVFNDQSRRNLEALNTINSDLYRFINALFLQTGGSAQVAYLIEMAPRLCEMHRVLKDTGSFFLQCDPTASHYLKVCLDILFGVTKFRSEIIWRRTGAHNTKAALGCVHDVIFYYVKGPEFTWHLLTNPYNPDYIRKSYRHTDERGRYRLDNLTSNLGTRGGPRDFEFRGVRPYQNRFWRRSKEEMEELCEQGLVVFNSNGMPEIKLYLDEEKGVVLQDLWDDIYSVKGKESVKFQGQKPVELLTRIISMASNPGDVVLDPYVGSGTTLIAAEHLDRKWIGIELSSRTEVIIRNRMAKEIGLDLCDLEAEVWPASHEDLQTLDPGRAEAWVVEKMLGGRRTKATGDGGYDGVVPYRTLDSKEGVFLVEVTTSGAENVKSRIDRLNNALDLLGHPHGFVVAPRKSLNRAARNLAASKGNCTYEEVPDRLYPRIQTISFEDLFDLGEKSLDLPGTLLKIEASQTAAGQEKAARELFDEAMSLGSDFEPMF